MSKKYTIRKNTFHYSDEHWYLGSMGAIVSEIFTSFSEAHGRLMDLEREAYLSIDLATYNPFSVSSDNVSIGTMVTIKNYFEKELSLDCLKVGKQGGVYAEYGISLPESITNEQLERIRDLSGLKFYVLVEFTDEPIFYGIWQKKPFFEDEGFGDSEGGPKYFYNSYMEAFNIALYQYYWGLNKTEIKGKLSDISDMPIILETLVKAHPDSLFYDENMEILKINNFRDKDLWASLCTLLKNKPFEIRLVNFEDVKSYEQSEYEW